MYIHIYIYIYAVQYTVHYEYMALARKTSVLREAMLLFIEPRYTECNCAPQSMSLFFEAMLKELVFRLLIRNALVYIHIRISLSLSLYIYIYIYTPVLCEIVPLTGRSPPALPLKREPPGLWAGRVTAIPLFKVLQCWSYVYGFVLC